MEAPADSMPPCTARSSRAWRLSWRNPPRASAGVGGCATIVPLEASMNSGGRQMTSEARLGVEPPLDLWAMRDADGIADDMDRREVGGISGSRYYRNGMHSRGRLRGEQWPYT